MLELSSELSFIELCLLVAGLGVDFDTVLTGALSGLFLADLVVSVIEDLFVDPLVERVFTGLLVFGDFAFLFELALLES